jgi:hypothetical protein
MLGRLRQRIARFVEKFENGELSLISDELWLTIPIEPGCAATRSDG